MSSHIGDGEAKPRCTAHQGDVDLGQWLGRHHKTASSNDSEAKRPVLVPASDPNNDVDEDNA